MPKWAEDGTQVVTPPDAKIERGFTRGQGVSVGHLNYALSLEGSNFYDPYPNVFEAVAGDLSATHSGTPVLPGVRFGYDSSAGGLDFFSIVTYDAGTADDPSGTLSAIFNYTKAGTIEALQLNSDNITATFDTGGLLLDGPTTAFNSENTIIRSQTLLTGGAFSSSHGFEASSKRVNTADTAADKRRYAYPSTDGLIIDINLSPSMCLALWDGRNLYDSTTMPNPIDPGAFPAPTTAAQNNNGWIVVESPNGRTQDFGIRRALPELQGNLENGDGIIDLAGVFFEFNHQSDATNPNQEIYLELIRVDKVNPDTGRSDGVAVTGPPAENLVFSLGSGLSGYRKRYQSYPAGIVTLDPKNYNYYIQYRCVKAATITTVKTLLVRELSLSIRKYAAE